MKKFTTQLLNFGMQYTQYEERTRQPTRAGTSSTVQRWYEDRRYQDILGMFSPGSLPEAGFNRTEVSPMWRESYVQVDPHMCCWANKRCRIMISYCSPTHFDWIPFSHSYTCDQGKPDLQVSSAVWWSYTHWTEIVPSVLHERILALGWVKSLQFWW